MFLLADLNFHYKVQGANLTHSMPLMSSDKTDLFIVTYSDVTYPFISFIN